MPSIHLETPGTPGSLVRILQSLTTLKMLYLCIDIDDMDPNKDMTEEVKCLQSIWKHLAHLEVLSICTTVDRGGFFCSKEERFPHLRELFIEEHYDLDKIHLDPFSNVSECYAKNETTLMIPCYFQLRLLSMYVYDLVDLGAFIREIDRCCPHLESLSLSFPGGQLPKRKSGGKPEVSDGSAILPNLKTFTLMTSNCDNQQILHLAKTLTRHYPSFANGTWSETLKPFGWALEGVRYVKYQSNPKPDINVTRCNLLLHPTPDGLLKKLYGEEDAERCYLNGYPTTFVIESPWNWLHHAFPNPWEELDLNNLKSTCSHLKQKLKSS